MRKTEGNLAVAERDAVRGVDSKKSRSGIQHLDASGPASFLVQRCVRIWPGSSPQSEMLGLSRQSLYVKLRRYGIGNLTAAGPM